MKKLVAYYSRDGNTKKIAEEIARNLKADLDEIKGKKNYSGIFGYIRAGYQAVKKKTPEISFEKNPEVYDIIIIGTPNWGSKMASPVRSYISRFDRKNKKFAFFCSQGGSGGEKIIGEMQEIFGQSENIIINQRDIADGSYISKISEFCKRLKFK